MDDQPPAPRDEHGGGLHEPLPASLHALLRRAVLTHAVTEHRRLHPVILHLGTPGGPEVVFAVRPDEPSDQSLRTDVVAAMLFRHRRAPGGTTAPLVWLTRPGDTGLQDVDVAWLAASWAAFAESGTELTMVVVDRHGWRDPRSGLSRHWVRLRSR